MGRRKPELMLTLLRHRPNCGVIDTETRIYTKLSRGRKEKWASRLNSPPAGRSSVALEPSPGGSSLRLAQERNDILYHKTIELCPFRVSCSTDDGDIGDRNLFGFKKKWELSWMGVKSKRHSEQLACDMHYILRSLSLDTDKEVGDAIPIGFNKVSHDLSTTTHPIKTVMRKEPNAPTHVRLVAARGRAGIEHSKVFEKGRRINEEREREEIETDELLLSAIRGAVAQEVQAPISILRLSPQLNMRVLCHKREKENNHSRTVIQEILGLLTGAYEYCGTTHPTWEYPYTNCKATTQLPSNDLTRTMTSWLYASHSDNTAAIQRQESSVATRLACLLPTVLLTSLCIWVTSVYKRCKQMIFYEVLTSLAGFCSAALMRLTSLTSFVD
uniref:Uncharacterized protein n=1 Tax=Timema shepardi TaxID=629360 RepID=A0A7R9AR81_TIMSH|nr:unnamed protein product [Timema shepardi]